MSLIDVDLARRFYTPTHDVLSIGGVGQGDEQPTFDIDVYIGRDILLDYILTIDGPSRAIIFRQR